jgi:hypothetical protein
MKIQNIPEKPQNIVPLFKVFKHNLVKGNTLHGCDTFYLKNSTD